MKTLDSFLEDYMRSDEFQALLHKDLDFSSPVTLTYALERLAIIHTKLFMMEDRVRNPDLSNAEIGLIKRRIDYWNGIVRPRLIEALGDIFAKAVKDGNEELVREPNFKDYKVK